ncbi:MAG: HEPN domain-containing protein [Chitinivibrionales bacterium]|nr:HEPN domain-containing protein [Chitinivibrionales bacterium]
MTDANALFEYRWGLARETLDDARKFYLSGGSPRSVVNRAYYAMFYAVLALFIKSNVPARTSRHSTIISIFDAEFIKPGKLDKNLSRSFHRAFDDRQEFDYKDYAQVEKADAEDILKDAEEFIKSIKDFIGVSSAF